MGFGKSVGFLSALAVLLAGGMGGAAADASPKNPRLTSFRSCGELLGYAKSNAARFVGPYGLGGPAGREAIAAPARGAAPAQGVDYSGTNVQEEGVDEPDLVKTNGNTLFAVAHGKLNAVDVRDPRPRLLDSLGLDAHWSHELLLHGNRLLVLSRGGFWAEPLPGIAARIAPYAPAQSLLSEVDVSEPRKLRLVRTLTLDGAYVAARLVGGSVRIVTAA